MLLDFDTFNCHDTDPFKYDKICKIQEHLNPSRPTFYYTPFTATHNIMQIAMVYGITEDEVRKLCAYKSKHVSKIAIRKFYFLKEKWLGRTYTSLGFGSD